MKEQPMVFQSTSIFSIIGSSIGFLGMLFSTVFFRFTTEKITQFTNITTSELLKPVYFACLMAAYCLSLTGAIKLYKFQRSGLYFYLMAQLMIMFLPVIWLGSNAFSSTNAIFSILFSGIYLFHYRLLH